MHVFTAEILEKRMGTVLTPIPGVRIRSAPVRQSIVGWQVDCTYEEVGKDNIHEYLMED